MSIDVFIRCYGVSARTVALFLKVLERFLMRSHRSQYNFKRILIHFFRPLIENCVFISGFQRAKLFRLIGYKNIGSEVFIGTNVYLDEVNPLGVHIADKCTVTRGGGTVDSFL